VYYEVFSLPMRN